MIPRGARGAHVARASAHEHEAVRIPGAAFEPTERRPCPAGEAGDRADGRARAHRAAEQGGHGAGGHGAAGRRSAGALRPRRALLSDVIRRCGERRGGGRRRPPSRRTGAMGRMRGHTMALFGWLRRGRRTGDAAALAERGAGGAVGEANPLMLIHGRTRTAGVPYALPRDMEEINRLDFQHYMLRFAFQGLYAAPIGAPASILDVGTGTGRWAIEMAELFPAARVVGLDVNPPPPDERASRGVDMRPPNYQFTPGNILEGLPFPDGAFDFVHMRLLFTGMPLDRWPSVIGELARVARPGGWVESVESANLLQTGPAFAQVQTWLNQVV